MKDLIASTPGTSSLNSMLATVWILTTEQSITCDSKLRPSSLITMMPHLRFVFITASILIVLSIAAGGDPAQSQEIRAQRVPQSSECLLRAGHIASTGQTLHYPGQSQIGDESAQEKAAHARSKRDVQSICANCELAD
jgi:hypothetical protein